MRRRILPGGIAAQESWNPKPESPLEYRGPLGFQKTPIPGIILGKKRGVLTQFFVCLTLTFLALITVDILESYGAASLNQLLGLSFIFNNLVIAALYLALPYILMIALDIRVRNNNIKKEDIEKPTEIHMEKSQTDKKVKKQNRHVN